MNWKCRNVKRNQEESKKIKKDELGMVEEANMKKEEQNINQNINCVKKTHKPWT